MTDVSPIALTVPQATAEAPASSQTVPSQTSSSSTASSSSASSSSALSNDFQSTLDSQIAAREAARTSPSPADPRGPAISVGRAARHAFRGTSSHDSSGSTDTAPSSVDGGTTPQLPPTVDPTAQPALLAQLGLLVLSNGAGPAGLPGPAVASGTSDPTGADPAIASFGRAARTAGVPLATGAERLASRPPTAITAQDPLATTATTPVPADPIASASFPDSADGALATGDVLHRDGAPAPTSPATASPSSPATATSLAEALAASQTPSEGPVWPFGSAPVATSGLDSGGTSNAAPGSTDAPPTGSTPTGGNPADSSASGTGSTPANASPATTTPGIPDPSGLPQVGGATPAADGTATRLPQPVTPATVTAFAASEVAKTATDAATSTLLNAVGASPLPLADVSSAAGGIPTTTSATLPSHVAELARMARISADGTARLTVRLDPPELGAVTLHMVSRGSTVELSLRAETPEGAAALAGQQARVRDVLAGHGFDLSRFSIGGGPARAAGAQQGGPGDPRQRDSFGSSGDGRSGENRSSTETGTDSRGNARSGSAGSGGAAGEGRSGSRAGDRWSPESSPTQRAAAPASAVTEGTWL